jgi:hypothetical protein
MCVFIFIQVKPYRTQYKITTTSKVDNRRIFLPSIREQYHLFTSLYAYKELVFVAYCIQIV